MPTREATAEMTNGDRNGTVVIEAETAEMAMERLADELGGDVRIVEARKIRRGGVGGFFSRELVQLTAEVGHDGEEPPAFSAVLAAQTEMDQSDDIAEEPAIEIRDLREAAKAPVVAPREDDIAAMALAASKITLAPQPDTRQPISIDLRTHSEPRRQMAEPEVLEPDPDPQSTAELVYERAAAMPEHQVPEMQAPTIVAGLARASHDDGRGAIDWGTTSLVRLGLPTPLINALTGVDRTDDLACLQTLAMAIAPMCGPIATEDVVIAGPAAWQVAMLMDVPMASPGEQVVDGAFGIDSTGVAADRGWLDEVATDRNLHLVISQDSDWRDLLFRSPHHVSWTDPVSVVDALYVASTLGATLALGVSTSEGDLLPARPLDVAIAVRNLMGRNQ